MAAARQRERFARRNCTKGALSGGARNLAVRERGTIYCAARSGGARKSTKSTRCRAQAGPKKDTLFWGARLFWGAPGDPRKTALRANAAKKDTPHRLFRGAPGDHRGVALGAPKMWPKRAPHRAQGALFKRGSWRPPVDGAESTKNVAKKDTPPRPGRAF